MTARLRAGLAAATLAAASLLACGDPNAPRASLATFTDTLQLYALNGSPRGAPAALRLLAGGFGGTPAVAPDVTLGFDVALDIDGQGRPVLLPLRTVASPFSATHRVGLARDTRAFASITEAPTTGYQHDSVTTVNVGETVLIETADPDQCSTLLTSGVLYGKMVVDSVNAGARRIYLRLTGDPNCGFRSFEPGVPAR
jgi:hypothetical protein